MMVPCFTLCHAFSFSSFNMYQTHPIVYSHPVFQCCFLLNCFFILCRKCTSNNLSQSSVLILVNVSKVPLSTQGWAHSVYHHTLIQCYYILSLIFQLLQVIMHNYLSWSSFSVVTCSLCFFPYKRSNTDHLKCERTVFLSGNTLQVVLHSLPHQIHHICYQHPWFQCCDTFQWLIN